MSDPSALSTENIVGTLLAGVGIAIVAIRQYLKERKRPTTQNGDRIVPGISIADMKPLRDIAEEHPKATAALDRIATGIEGIHAIMKDRQAAEAEAEANDLRDRIHDLERLLADNKAAPRRRRAT